VYNIEARGLADHQTESTASHTLLADSNEGYMPKVGRELQMAAMIPVGGFTDGINHALKNPGEFTLQMAGASALTLACRGPQWLRIPATVVAVLGAAEFGYNTVQSAVKTAPNFQDAWASGRNMDTNLTAVRENLGPAAFDFAAMSLAAKATNSFAVKLHGTTPAEVGFALKNRANYYSEITAQSLGLRNDFALATEGRGILNMVERQPDVFDAPAKGKDTFAMSTSDSRGGGGGGDKFNYRSWRTVTGDSVHDFVNAFEHDQLGNEFTHNDHSKTFLGYRGEFRNTFLDGHVRSIDIGQPIRHINIVEAMSGEKEFRFNGNTGQPDVVTSPDRRSILANMRNGDTVVQMDTLHGLTMSHADGLIAKFSPDGRIQFQQQDISKAFMMGQTIGRVISISHPDGTHTFKFLDAKGAPHANQVTVPKFEGATQPPLPQYQGRKSVFDQRPPGPMPPPPMNGDGPAGSGPSVFDQWASQRDSFRGSRGSGRQNGPGIFDQEFFPRMPATTMDDSLLRGQGHNRWMYRYLSRLGKGDNK
jgi:hypothetical protein